VANASRHARPAPAWSHTGQRARRHREHADRCPRSTASPSPAKAGVGPRLAVTSEPCSGVTGMHSAEVMRSEQCSAERCGISLSAVPAPSVGIVTSARIAGPSARSTTRAAIAIAPSARPCDRPVG
jgi:hypothetical protein